MLKDLLTSIEKQDFPKSQIEVLVITEGDSEQAKAIGIRRAKGYICAMFCADNYIKDPHFFFHVYRVFQQNDVDCVYTRQYWYDDDDNSLNRYFSLIGCNDPVPFYLGKNDREPWVDGIYKRRGIPSYGCNGTFVKRECFKYTNLDDYYPMDAHVDMIKNGNIKYFVLESAAIWHRTSDKLIPFLKKRYRYARELYCQRRNRRWKMVGNSSDKFRLALFVVAGLTIIQPLLLACRGFSQIRDRAWFWHPAICLSFTIMYGLLACRNFLEFGNLFQIGENYASKSLETSH